MGCITLAYWACWDLKGLNFQARLEYWSAQLGYLTLMPYYLITKHLAEPAILPSNAYVFNKIEPKD